MFTITVTKSFAKVVELRTLNYFDWPQEARGLARVVLGKPGAVDEMMAQVDRKDWLARKVEQLHKNNNSIAEWLGDA